MTYFARRFRRIFPPYWIALALTVALVVLVSAIGRPELVYDEDPVDTGVIPHPSTLSPAQWLGNLTLTEQWRHHLFGEQGKKILGPSWSLCYEEQFYLICGLIVMVAPRRFFSAISLVTALTIGGMFLPLGYQSISIEGFFFDGHWLLFAAGVLVYYHINHALATHQLWIMVCLTCVVGILIVFRYAFLEHGGSIQRSQVFDLLVGAVFALALLLLYPWDAVMSRAAWLRPFAFCGTMCYSLYLVHWPVTKVVAALFYGLGVYHAWPTILVVVPLSLAASISLSWTFHFFVERRFLNEPIKPPKVICVLQPGFHERALHPAIEQSNTT